MNYQHFSTDGGCHYQKSRYMTNSLINNFAENANWNMWFGRIREKLVQFIKEYFKYFNRANKKDYFQQVTHSVENLHFFSVFRLNKALFQPHFRGSFFFKWYHLKQLFVPQRCVNI